MSTSLLYHGFGIVGYHYVSQSFQEGEVTFRIEQPRERHRCSHCGSTDVWDQGGVERSFRMVPLGSKRKPLPAPRLTRSPLSSRGPFPLLLPGCWLISVARPLAS
jgi:hypothetical protein